jgi:hypothetical protein
MQARFIFDACFVLVLLLNRLLLLQIAEYILPAALLPHLDNFLFLPFRRSQSVRQLTHELHESSVRWHPAC